MSSILQGMRVVEGSAFVAVPLAGMTLAQMGADVIRFDAIGGGLDYGRWPLAPNGQSLFWAGMNKGKRSIAVDIRAPRGRELITEVITAPGRDAGLFLTNMAVKGWTDHDTLAKRRADMISVSLTGDRHGNPAVDYTVNPALGFPEITGPEGSHEPVSHALPAWDCIAGNMAVSALLAAERHRLRTGAGQGVAFSLKDAAAAMLGHLGILGDVALNGNTRGKAGNALYGAYGQDFLCADGRRIMVIGLTARQWKGLVEATGTGPEIAALEERIGTSLGDEGQRWTHRHEITKILRGFFSAHRVDEFADDFNARGLTWSEFRDFARAMAEDPDLSPENPMFEILKTPGLGTFLTPGNPVAFTGFERTAPAAPPRLGEHTEEVLADVVRLPDNVIGKLFDDRIVAADATGAQRSAA